MIVDDIRGVEVDLQILQPDAMDRNRKEVCDSGGTGVFETRVPKGEGLQLGQSHSELGDIVVLEFEHALVPALFIMAEDFHTETDQVPKYSNRGDEGTIDNGTGSAFDGQGFHGLFQLKQWFLASSSGGAAL